VLGSALTLGTAYPAAREAGLPLRLSAHLVNLSTFGATGSLGTVEIVVTRWSTDAERDRLLGAMHDGGMTSLPEMLRNLPSIGYIRTPHDVPFEIHYAHRSAIGGGANRVVVATDRYIPFQQSSEHSKLLDYPFTFVEVRLDQAGKGEGRMSVAARLTSDGNGQLVVLEEYGSEPMRLQEVKAHSSR
jgi:hypothetical protein